MRNFARGRAHDVCSTCLLRSGRQSSRHDFDSLPQASGIPRVSSRTISCTMRRSRLSVATTPGGTPYGAVSSRLIFSPNPQIDSVVKLRDRLHQGMNVVCGELKGNPKKLQLGDILQKTATEDMSSGEKELLKTVQKVYAGQPYLAVAGDLGKAAKYGQSASKATPTKAVAAILQKIGITPPRLAAPMKSKPRSMMKSLKILTSGKAPVQGKTPALNPDVVRGKKVFHLPDPTETGHKVEHSIEATQLLLEPVSTGHKPDVPRLSFDLSRVLFNPGVYHLRDPRSRVYNFDPYLERPMPMTEFNFEALNEYITSSKDTSLKDLAGEHGKRYVGSSSSMGAVLSQLHFLLSQWRPLDVNSFSRGFGEGRADYTVITRTPAAIFLRWKDGVYAVDADKEYDEPNVLMSLGKSMEKLLTLEKKDFEKWRRNNTAAGAEPPQSYDEAYHYSSQGKFLLRSQLDAYDPRLPGSGIFDLKTRAVAGIRLNLREHESGQTYEIRHRLGTWESFEREYYDMARSAFLKYSLQVRMGNMDGIFVAYHNIERLFGFQYMPLSELDQVIHGQSDTTLGDQEFRVSIQMLESIFDRVTKQFPEQSVRLHFETREPSASEPLTYMHVFAEPWSAEEIDTMAAKSKAQVEAYERAQFYGEDVRALKINSDDPPNVPAAEQASLEDFFPTSTLKLASQGTTSDQRSSDSSDADTALVDKMLSMIPPETKTQGPRPLLALYIKTQNKVDGRPVTRPEAIEASSNWTVDYTIQEVHEERARRLHTFCKNRRMAALQSTRSSRAPFFQHLRKLNLEGARWREHQDAIDAERQRVVLYSDRID